MHSGGFDMELVMTSSLRKSPEAFETVLQVFEDPELLELRLQVYRRGPLSLRDIILIYRDGAVASAVRGCEAFDDRFALARMLLADLGSFTGIWLTKGRHVIRAVG